MGQNGVARGREEEAAGDGLAVGFGERVPDEVGALRDGDEPDGFVERLGVDVAAADLRLSARGVERVGPILRGVGQQDLAGAIGVARRRL